MGVWTHTSWCLVGVKIGYVLYVLIRLTLANQWPCMLPGRSLCVEPEHSVLFIGYITEEVAE